MSPSCEVQAVWSEVLRAVWSEVRVSPHLSITPHTHATCLQPHTELPQGKAALNLHPTPKPSTLNPKLWTLALWPGKCTQRRVGAEVRVGMERQV